ncbi:unnamed protein product [Sphagnum balticum]
MPYASMQQQRPGPYSSMPPFPTPTPNNTQDISMYHHTQHTQQMMLAQQRSRNDMPIVGGPARQSVRSHSLEIVQHSRAQKFFEYGTNEHKTQLVANIKNRVLDFSLQMYGCRVIQKALENVTPDQQVRSRNIRAHAHVFAEANHQRTQRPGAALCQGPERQSRYTKDH